MKKFTIADKEEAQEILGNNSSLSQEDKEILKSKPVFSVLKTLFEKYYDLELLSVYESDTFSTLTKPIEKYWPNPEEFYVSMVSSNDYLLPCYRSRKVSKKTAELPEKKEFKNEEEVREIDQELHSRIDAYVNEHIANWTEMCECEEEGEALESFLNRHLPSWRVWNDGTVDVIVEGKSIESFDFEWEDEEGEERTSNALDLFRGNVSHEFDEDCNNDFVWSRDIEKEVIALFK